MARIWKERLTTFGTANLSPREVILVRVASFTFRFTTTKQLRDCIDYYEQKTHRTSRISAKTIAADIGPDWRELRSREVERWFERLPMYLLEEPKRQKVLKALHKTLALVEAGKTSGCVFTNVWHKNWSVHAERNSRRMCRAVSSVG